MYIRLDAFNSLQRLTNFSGLELKERTISKGPKEKWMWASACYSIYTCVPVSLIVSLSLTTDETFVDSLDRIQTAQDVQSDF